MAVAGLLGLVTAVVTSKRAVARETQHCEAPCLEGLLVPVAGAAGLIVGVVVGWTIYYDTWQPARVD
jgi:hypothetical protein